MRRATFFILMMFILSPLEGFGQEDIIPIRTPNAMIIFDTSSSMNQTPDLKDISWGNTECQGKLDGQPIWFYGGGDCPGSKLYQAKTALTDVIENVVQDKVNLGFATYSMEARPQVACSYRQVKGYLYKNYWVYPKEKFSPWYISPRSPFVQPVLKDDCVEKGNCMTSFLDDAGNRIDVTHVGQLVWIAQPTNMHIYPEGCTFPPHPLRGCSELPRRTSKMLFKVTEYYPSDEFHNAKFHLESVDAYQAYNEMVRVIDTQTGATCGDDKKNRPFLESYPYVANGNEAGPLPPGSPPYYWTSYFSDDTGVRRQEYDTGMGRYGNWKCFSQCQTFHMTWKFPENTCPDTAYGYKKLPDSKTYDATDYSFPSWMTGSGEKSSWSYYGADSWPRTELGYPSTDSSGRVNNTPGTFNNRYFFVNFPDDKDPRFNPSDRKAAKDQILKYMDVTPVPDDSLTYDDPLGSCSGIIKHWTYYRTKLPRHADFGRQGLTTYTFDSLSTPLADSLGAANAYFKSYIYDYKGGDKYSQNGCRSNYTILLTDGMESIRKSGQSVDYSAAPQEAAKLLSIGVRTFVIGFGVDVKGNQTIQNIARSGGTDHAYFATNLQELRASLASIFDTILAGSYGRSCPVVNRDRSRVLKGYFEINRSLWKGNLNAWSTKQNGLLDSELWEAGPVMNAKGRGSVYTWLRNGLTPRRTAFRTSEDDLYPLVNPNGEDINEDGSPGTDQDARTVIEFTLNPDHDGGRYRGARTPNWKLDDIYHSTPVVVAEPAFSFNDPTYKAFSQANKNREKMAYVGADDGMLHAFKMSDGSELYSIIPRSLLGKLKNLKQGHDFYVDSSPKVYDAHFKGVGKWKTILISGLKRGGPYYFAVDVTDPYDPQILWEWTDNYMGEAWGKPDIGRVKVNGEIKTVAFITGGYSTSETKGDGFYIVDIETGTTLKRWINGLSTTPEKFPSGPVAFDSNGDGLVDYVYCGDTLGKLWKVDVTKPNPDDWQFLTLFTPPSDKRRPIYYTPAVTKNSGGKILVYFGTGDESHLLDRADNYFWEIWDDGGNGSVISGSKWPMKLTNEKILASPSVANNVVYFTSWAPSAEGDCGAGEGKLFGLNISRPSVTGGTDGLVYVREDGSWSKPDPSDPNKIRYITIGQGIPTAPVVTNGAIYVSTSVKADQVKAYLIPGWGAVTIKAWREVFGK